MTGSTKADGGSLISEHWEGKIRQYGLQDSPNLELIKKAFVCGTLASLDCLQLLIMENPDPWHDLPTLALMDRLLDDIKAFRKDGTP